MNKKKFALMLVGIFVTLFVGTTIFFVSHGLYASWIDEKFYERCWSDAEAYMKSDPELLQKYGAEDLLPKDPKRVSISYFNRRHPIVQYLEIFALQYPKTVEEYQATVAELTFRARIGWDDYYDVTMGRNEQGEFVVLELKAVEEDS
jgi:hypothetical protein